MNKKIITKLLFILVALALGTVMVSKTWPVSKVKQTVTTVNTRPFTPEITKTDEEWKKQLTTAQYVVLRQGGTDVPFTHEEMLYEKRKGTYVTVDCDEPVFRSEQKFDSGTGWPSFWAPIEGSVIEVEDRTTSMIRTEIVGKKCGGHLGHVFEDGPKPTGKRYCINATALKFIPDP